MRLATVSQCRSLDELSVKAYGLGSDTLMEAAGLMAARELQQNFYPELARGMTAIVCGPGNNGADGLVMARHLHSMGFRDLLVFIVTAKPKRSPLFKLQFSRAEKHGLRIVEVSANNIKKNIKKLEQLRSAVLVVDALFGIGLKKKPEGIFQTVIERMNSTKLPIVSLDTPSGLDCDNGVVMGVAAKAHTTFTFGLAKPGFFVADGPMYVGKLRTLPIGYPYECLRGVATTHFVFSEKLARRYLPVRKDRSNKSDFGRLVVLAGSENTWGAGILSAQSAYRIGAGYVTWAGRDLPLKHLEQTPEVMTAKLDDDAIWDLKKITAYAVGPGLGVNDDTLKIVRRLKELSAGRVVIDADAIAVCAQAKNQIFPLPSSWVMTPHSGELAKLLKRTVQEVEADRFGAALAGAKLTGCHVLLKGFRSILAYEKRCLVINSGNSALAKAGSGDVLTGMIGGLLAQGLDTVQATATAAYIHGRLADEWVRTGHDKRTLNPSDLKEPIGQLISRISHGAVF